MVKSVVAIDGPRVRFTVNAFPIFFFLIESSPLSLLLGFTNEILFLALFILREENQGKQTNSRTLSTDLIDEFFVIFSLLFTWASPIWWLSSMKTKAVMAVKLFKGKVRSCFNCS